MSDVSKLADVINEKLDTLHDSAVSEDPFVWSDSKKDRKARTATFRDISEKFTLFVYVPKTGTVVKILLFGTVLPLVALTVLYLTKTPVDEDIRLWVWGGLGVVAIISGIVAAIIAHDPNISSDLCLAAYTVPRNWSFSRAHTKKTWRLYQKHYGYFDQGDEDQAIRCRIWGYLDEKRERPFQLFHFYFETVYYTTEIIRDSNGKMVGTRQVKHEVPHHRYGMFAAMPESKIHFRITKNGGTIYNSLVAGRLKVKESFSGIYVQLKRRADLIPNLVTAVKGYAKHERETLENLTRLRTEFLRVNPNDRSAVIEQGNMLSQALKSIFAVSENYPNLKASDNFLKLQGSLEETEDQVAAARRIYNANVNDYNTSVQQFPSNIVAGCFRFSEEPFFQTDQTLDEVPKFSF